MNEALTVEMIGKRIKETREAMGLSQNQLQLKTGIPSSAISQYETGKRAPNHESLQLLAKALYVTTDYLLGLDTDPDAQPEEEEPKNPIRDEVLEDEEFWKSRGIFPPSDEEKKHLRESYSFRITFKNMDELKRGYQDIYVYLLQKEREKKSR